ncbi:MAG TPA: glycosyltransferase [Solirubrobacterales bacterium]|nr:glycosyltransferase [Solirubrobacterales bacterium]
MSERIPVLYLAPWVGYGGSDTNTIDWFRWIDRERFAPSLIVTQPSPNPLIEEVAPFAEEVWVLPDLMPAERMPAFIFDFLHSRQVRVLHVMNSKLGFDLLPDLSCLPNPPSVVVQLHVEEVDRSGYVRYVTTRYGNLVDSFSISNQHVAEAVRGYGVPADKVEVIYTGVDAEGEFDPSQVDPIEPLPEDRLDVLYAARLVDQKDPLLMVEVAAGLQERGVDFQFQVVGEGEMEAEVKQLVAARGLGDRFRFHPPTPGLHPWYAATDAMLMTSRFEGVPCALFEAMSMGLPVVVPNLPGIAELLCEPGDDLIEPRDDAAAYVEALARLAADREGSRRKGAALRERIRSRFSAQQMADEHGAVYERLAASQERPEPEQPPAPPEPIRFRDRPVASQPLVSVLIPHYNQAAQLTECVDSVQAQTYPHVEIVIADDASTQSTAATVLDELEAREGVTVIRLDENRGPSVARNAGLEKCSGRYILPVDSDNLLFPETIEKLVLQLSVANEDVGFIYPNLEYFGNREGYHKAPEYNLYTLLHGNFCDTCSLLDRQIFDAGIRYSEEIKLGHEDWEFVLRLAAHGIRGEAAEGPTLRYRKWGFNRSDMVDHAPTAFLEGHLAKISPFKGREARIKAAESPAVSLVALGAVDFDSEPGRELVAKLESQSCVDLELVAHFDGTWPQTETGPVIRRGGERASGEPLRRGLESARGAFAVLTAGSGASLLDDPAFCEKVLRRFAIAGEELDAIVLADAGAEGCFGFRALPAEDGPPDPRPHTVVWRRTFERELPYGLLADPAAPVSSLIRLFSGAGGNVEWRHLPFAEDPALLDEGKPRGWQPMPPDPGLRADPFHPVPAARPLLPGEDGYLVPRWELTPTWIPPLSTIAIRYRERIGEHRVVANNEPGEHFHLEHFVGSLRSTGLPGTTKIVRIGGTYEAIPRERWAETPSEAIELGYAEEAPLPGYDGLNLAVHRASGQHLLVSLPDDPLLNEVDVVQHLGFIDPFPIRPRQTPSAERPVGLVGLVKSVDHEAQRHYYAIDGSPAEGELVSELGAIGESELQGSIAAWIADGYLVTERYSPPMRKPGAFAALRWTAEPVAWRGLAPIGARLKTVTRRSGVSLASRVKLGRGTVQPSGAPVGWLFESARPNLVPLYASHHPVTGDQLLTRSLQDAAAMGYVDSQLLGFMRAAAPVTDNLGHRGVVVPWARRSGTDPQAA